MCVMVTHGLVETTHVINLLPIEIDREDGRGKEEREREREREREMHKYNGALTMRVFPVHVKYMHMRSVGVIRSYSAFGHRKCAVR